MTLASDRKNTISGRPETRQSNTHRQVTAEAMPPTLLRLPDLDPVAQPPADVSEAETETRSFDETSVFPMTSTGSSALPVAAASASWKASVAEADEAKKVKLASRTETRDDASESSLLARFASRKVLLALLMLIAGAAIWMPRQQDSAKSPLDGQIAESTSDTNFDEIEIDFERPLTPRVKAPELLADSEFNNLLAAPENKIVTSPTASLTQIEIARPAQSAGDFQDTFPGPSMDEAFPNATAATSMTAAPDFSALPPPPFPPVAAPIQRVSTQTPDFDAAKLDAVATSLAAAANEEIRRMDAARFTASQVENNVFPQSTTAVMQQASAKPELPRSRTPSGDIDWAGYLPRMDDSSYGAQSGGPPSSGPPSATAKVASGRPMTSVPQAPDFRFALPPGSNLAPSASPPAASAPAARVAMPPINGNY